MSARAISRDIGHGRAVAMEPPRRRGSRPAMPELRGLHVSPHGSARAFLGDAAASHFAKVSYQSSSADIAAAAERRPQLMVFSDVVGAEYGDGIEIHALSSMPC